MTKFTGKTVNDALNKGLKALRLNRNQVNLKVITEGSRGFLGIGNKPAVIDLQEINKEATVVEKDVTLAAERRLAKNQAVEVLGEYLADVTEAMGIKTEIEVTQDEKLVTYAFDTQQVGQLIGKHGRTLDALQTLAENFLARHKGQKLDIILDVANYREEQRKNLVRMAKRKAEQVLKSQQPVNCPTMLAFERKIIHQTLARSNVETISVGKEPHRYVKIYPDKK
ncbi:RNA-binding cell elongation regulator Jag/EloR [Liquorilactobacillus sicerae]|uniref:RNA-binding cell elongation regulator Jag/EloR n=1 Tax=Liquorilactobacillus sicerae TaxID=1416943 RepID=UPI0024813D59|nr:RNA-binding cell elongation regulator Jag/EloR [Liquorilactobacillus sicerae]